MAALSLLLAASGCPEQNPTAAKKIHPAGDQSRETGIAAIELRADLQPIAGHIRRHNHEVARELLTRHLRQHPNDGQAIFLRGLSFHREQRYALAIQYFDRALELAPDFALPHYYRGWAQYYLGDLPNAAAAFTTFLQVKPDEPDSHFALGLIALDKHDLHDAERWFLRSIELWDQAAPRTGAHDQDDEPGGPTDPRSLAKAHARLSEVYEHRAAERETPEGEQAALRQAKAHLQTAVNLYPDHYEALYRLYRVLVRLGEHEQADAMHRQYLETKERIRPGTSFPE